MSADLVGSLFPGDVPENSLLVHSDDGAAFVLRGRAQPDAASPVILLLPAMGVTARYYAPFVAALFSRGMSVVACDLRGQGESSVPDRGRSGSGYHDRVERDWPAITAATRTLFPDAPLFIVGHSLGGQLSLLYAAIDAAGGFDRNGGPDLAGVAVIGTGTAHHRAFGRRAAYVLFGGYLITAVTRTLGYWPGHRLGFGGRQPAGLMLDWTRHSRTGRYEPTGSTRDFDALLASLSLPVLVVSLGTDHLAPRRAVDDLCRRLPAAHLTRLHLDHSDGLTKLGHFDWVKDPTVVATQIATWLAATRQQFAGGSGDQLAGTITKSSSKLLPVTGRSGAGRPGRRRGSRSRTG